MSLSENKEHSSWKILFLNSFLGFSPKIKHSRIHVCGHDICILGHLNLNLKLKSNLIMDKIFNKINSALFILVLILSSQSVLGNNLYRWVDNNGNVYYSDQVPPEHAEHRREALNKNARTIKVFERDKTKAQRELEKRLQKLRRQKDKIVAKQRSYDRVLLSTYRSVGDMQIALKAKMSALETQKQLVKGNLRRLELQLLQQQKKAAQYERDGTKVPAKLLADISASKEKVEETFIDISKRIEKKKKSRQQFEVDIARYAFLTQSDSVSSKVLSQKTAENKAADELGLFICETSKQCNKAWISAKQYVFTHSMTALDIETNRLIMSQAPYKDNELSLSVSKLKTDDDKFQLFLDVRCRNSSLGKELCKASKAKKLRRSFNGYIKSALGINKI